MEITSEGIRAALGSNPTLTLLKAYSGDWVLPLFAELEQIDGSVSAEWFHERVSEARAQIPEWQSNVTPAEHCRDWVEKRWLETETLNGRLRYRLSPYCCERCGSSATLSKVRRPSVAPASSPSRMRCGSWLT